VAYQVEMTASTYFPDSTGVLGWVGPPDENGVARVVSAPHFTDTWPPAVYLGDCEIVPVADYAIRPTPDGVSFGDPILLSTIAQPDKWWADVVGPKVGRVWSGPDGFVNFDDIQAAIQTFEGVTDAPHWARVDVAVAEPDKVVNMTDVQFIILAFEGATYPFAAPADCP
jgi:hypothetical protein